MMRSTRHDLHRVVDKTSEKPKAKIALVGCPNVGKTSLFNALTGSKQYVANWPGVTVEKKEGVFVHRGLEVSVIDLPGTYALDYISLDERITRDYILSGEPDLIVLVGDSVNPEQSLYLLLEVIEMEKKVALVLTAYDEAKKMGIKIDRYELQKHLGVPVVLVSSVTGEGIEELKDLIVDYSTRKDLLHRVHLDYGEEIERRIRGVLGRLSSLPPAVPPRYFAMKYLSGDTQFYQEALRMGLPELPEEERIAFKISLSKKKREIIESVIKEAHQGPEEKTLSLSEAIDHVLTHKYLSFPLFFALMYLVFKFTFETAQVFSDLLDLALASLGSSLVEKFGENAFSSFVVDGLISGVGSVLTFVPNIFFLFLAMGFLEESGYLPRAAFVMDRIMEKFKLSGRSFMSLLLGFGCNVSSVMSTRVIDDPKERLVTILISPFVSCSARLPVYLLILRIFFPKASAAFLFSLYTLSISITLLSSSFINWLFYRGRSSPLIIELPRYRFPTFRNLYLYTWNRGKHFLKKAGTIILLTSIVMWSLNYFPGNGNVEESFSADIGRALTWVFKPFDYSWKITLSLLYGMVAKEVVVSSLTMLYNFDEVDLERAWDVLSPEMNPLKALAFLVFVMAYIPCIATVAVIYSETNSLKWTLFSVVYSFGIAYGLSLAVYKIGGLVVGL